MTVRKITLRATGICMGEHQNLFRPRVFALVCAGPIPGGCGAIALTQKCGYGTPTPYSPPGGFVPNLHQGAHISRGPQVSRTHLSAAVSPRMEWQIKRTALPCHGSNPRPIAIDYYVRTPMGRVLRIPGPKTLGDTNSAKRPR